MFAIRVDLLTERYYATAFNNRQEGEWPPHPGRLFSAMVATWADEEPKLDDERQALRWLEEQPPPEVCCDDLHQVARRRVHTHFVPVNDVAIVRSLDKAYDRHSAALDAAASADGGVDAKFRSSAQEELVKAEAAAVTASRRESNKTGAPDGALQLLPEERGRQPRTFPAVSPSDPTIYFVWPDADPSPDRVKTLDGLLARLARLGHSSSLVAASVANRVPESTMVPSASGPQSLRIPTSGLLDALEAAHDQHGGTAPRVLPNKIVAYGVPGGSESLPNGDYDDSRWVLLLAESTAGVKSGETKDADENGSKVERLLQNIPVSKSLAWTRALRGSILRHAEAEVAYLGGHNPDGTRLLAPHPAFVALGFVDAPHADGRCRAFAVIPPRDITGAQRDALDEAIARWGNQKEGRMLFTGRGGAMRLELATVDDAPHSGRPARWSAPSARWASVTPIVLDRFPKHLRSDDPTRRAAADAQVRETIRRAIILQRLPEPVEVRTSDDPLVRGSAPVRGFPAYRHGKNSRSRPLSVHAQIVFDEPVAGPLIIGGGRHLGYGLCTPLAGWGGGATAPSPARSEQAAPAHQIRGEG